MNKERIKSALSDIRLMPWLWIALGVISALCKMKAHNNFDIFRYVFYNTWQEQSLYSPATDGGFWDLNHYGPFFSMIIAPFAVIPERLGLILWCTCLSVFLYWAVSRYSMVSVAGTGMPAIQPPKTKSPNPYVLPFIIWFCAHELLTALFMQQFNIAIAGIILLSYYFVEKERDKYATLFIVIGTLVKIYGIVGLAFFFFSKHKKRYVISLLLWTAVLFCLPMLISSPEYQLLEYREWFECLGGKNGENLLSRAQNISFLGIVRKLGYACTVGHADFMSVTAGDVPVDMHNWWMRRYSDLWLIVAAMAAMAAGYFRICQWNSKAFRETVLAGVLMFVCLFSTGTESSGYIIAVTGCVIWYCCAPWKRTKTDTALMIFVFLLTIMSPSDLFPGYIRQEFIQPYALKALPVAMVWMKLCHELITKDYTKATPQTI
ncbi:MAG: DUF2029 domain-containing protein [Bacteroidales bacterium]|nr:DUF2029 domain-containing protein [Bacteroidales bacterium]MCM1146521.1 DUF2029 domain-containing protein [Bacteroidales bacterium]MCM1205913.1 DUF2029 domain-containing protein [Bacillota bacterium]MCM1510209.1 DUF2029 domain-containing protein [Clostridium sp.]